MQIKPVLEQDATGIVKESYLELTNAFHTRSLPMFFTFLGPFPEYLTYITKQLTTNVNDNNFKIIVEEAQIELKTLIKDSLTSSEEKNEWLKRYSSSPSFYYFKKDLNHIFSTNIKICLIFIALREAIKGWAVAAKQLPSDTPSTSSSKEPDEYTVNSFIYEGILPSPPNKEKSDTNSKDITNQTNAIAVSQPNAIEHNLLPVYLLICRSDFSELMKEERFLLTRVTIEKLFLSYIGILPHLIFSPINVVFDLTSTYKNFPDLLYLLSEHFPTYAVQRMMFSAYINLS